MVWYWIIIHFFKASIISKHPFHQEAIILFILFFKLSWCKIAKVRQGIESIPSTPKQQRRPLPSLLYLSLLFAARAASARDRPASARRPAVGRPADQQEGGKYKSSHFCCGCCFFNLFFIASGGCVICGSCSNSGGTVGCTGYCYCCFLKLIFIASGGCVSCGSCSNSGGTVGCTGCQVCTK